MKPTNGNYYQELPVLLQTNSLFSIKCLIPSYSVRLSTSNRCKPLGIAYGVFGSLEDANTAIEALDKSTFKNRIIRVRLHVPYVPRIRHRKPIKTGEVAAKLPDGVKDDKPHTNSDENVAQNVFSEDTVFFKTKGKFSSDEIRDFFSDFSVKEVYQLSRKFTGARRPSLLHHSPTVCLVTINLEDGVPIQKVIDTLQNHEFKSKFWLSRAYLAKVESVTKESEKRLKQQEADKEDKAETK